MLVEWEQAIIHIAMNKSPKKWQKKSIQIMDAF